MPERPAVSVCIPTHNRASNLACRLEELRKQTMTDLEIVVVDDGSTDATEGVVRAAMHHDSRVRYISVCPAIGHPAVLMRCFEEGRADMVAIFHDHDAYRSNAVESLAAALTAAPQASFAFCAVRTLDPVTREVCDVSADPGAPRLRGDIVRHFVCTGHSLVGASAVMVRPSQLPVEAPSEEMGLFADVEMWCRMARSRPAAYIADPLVDVVGWTPLEALVKLNWCRLGTLQRLRREFVPVVAQNRLSRWSLHLRIGYSTAVDRVRWLARVLAYARRAGEYPAGALIGVPSPIAVILRIAVSAAPRAAAR